MKKVAVISCGTTKKTGNPEAVFTGSLFARQVAYAKSVSDVVMIATVHQGLLGLDDVVEPNNSSFKDLTTEEIKLWAERVNGALPEGEYIYMMGKTFRRYLPEGEVPFAGLRLNELSEKLTELGF